ncbi:hypothetical protein HYC85_015172 [Camellia sinensis]|uniref:Bulb-type lectin domain-containing protein n=1 Tax=Camellia sinensis TaxID=4442 RepID=A0A7J7H9G8_CAMSI|nr:hypothetical protein HYC85_015172 [Camellia sinensis]
MANLSTSWINNPSILINSSEVILKLTPIFNGSNDLCLMCGFYCPDINACLFGVVIFPWKNYFNYASMINDPQLDHLVQINATLQLTGNGDLILRDADGTFVWSTNTSGKSVIGLNFTGSGNLVLFDRNDATVWQSFDHPTNSLLVGQTLFPGQKLTSSTSSSNSTPESNPPLPYFQSPLCFMNDVKYENGSFIGQNIPLASSSSSQFKSGGLNLNAMVVDLLTSGIGDCAYPMVYGNYDICSSDGQCACPDDAYSETMQKSSTAPTNSPLKKSRQVTIMLGSSLGTFFGVFFVVTSCFFLLTKKRESEKLDEFFVDQVPGSPTRFSYEELRVMTSNFNDKLREGGFGMVFHGTLSDGT